MLATAASAGACFDLSGPADDVASIGSIRAAWPSVVLGDTLRDSTGAVAPLRVAAFDAHGDTIRDARPQLAVVGETERALRIDEDGRVLGLSVREGAAASDTVIALFFGLQAPKLVLATVLRPDFVTRPAGDIEEQKLVVAPNDTSSKVTPAQLTVHVWHRYATGESAGVPHWIVSYEIVEQPASTDGQPVAFLAASAARSTRDTTDAQGTAARNLLVRAHRMSQVQDTVVVRARAVYRGAMLPGTSTLEFRVPLALGIAAP
jgi:hypothetical protein